MQFNTFKLSAIALAVASLPTAANAAPIYSVERVENTLSSNSSQSSIATAISSSDVIGYELQSGPVGIDYSQEVPFFVDNSHYMVSRDDFELHCSNYLGYDTCGSWADERWFGLQDSGEICDQDDFEAGLCNGGKKAEIEAWDDHKYTSNSKAYSSADGQLNPFGSKSLTNPPSGNQLPDTTNVIVNAIDSDGRVFGSSSSPFFDGSNFARAFALRGYIEESGAVTELLPPSDSSNVIAQIGQTNANGFVSLGGSRYLTFGSASIANMADPNNESKAPEGSGLVNLESCDTTVDYNDRACQYFQFANQAAVWVSDFSNNPANARTISSFANGTTRSDETAQASVRGAALVNSTSPTLVGYSTYEVNSNFYTTAVKFKPISDETAFDSCLDPLNTASSLSCWTTEIIPGINIESGDDIIYDYTVANDINSNGITVGVAKSNNPQNGSLAELVFINKDSSTTVLSSSQSSLFFRGYNATAASINDDNELVGKVDVETVQDRSRRQRGYIYLYDSPHLSQFNGAKGWLLDDLTNDGNASGKANQFRIAEAFDINDEGDIAASAFYCAGGYSSTAQNALCDGTEQLVAVKLTRNDSGTITPRSEITEPVQRSGASFGLAGLGLLVLGGLWRRKK